VASKLGKVSGLVLLAVAFVASVAIGDGTQQGTLSTKVIDDNGQPLPGVTVELISSDKGFQRSQTTDAEGLVTFALLQPGPYMVRATLSGLKPMAWRRVRTGSVRSASPSVTVMSA